MKYENYLWKMWFRYYNKMCIRDRFDGIGGLFQHPGNFIFNGCIEWNVGEYGLVVADMKYSSAINFLDFLQIPFPDLVEWRDNSFLGRFKFLFCVIRVNGVYRKTDITERFIFLQQWTEFFYQFFRILGQIFGDIKIDNNRCV